jgi:hypothetical protein
LLFFFAINVYKGLKHVRGSKCGLSWPSLDM